MNTCARRIDSKPRTAIGAALFALMMCAPGAGAQVTGRFAEAPMAQTGDPVTAFMTIASGDDVHGINGELTFDENFLANPRVAPGDGAEGYLAEGNLAAPGMFRFILFTSDVTQAVDPAGAALVIAFDTVGGLSGTNVTTVDIAMEAAANIIQGPSPTDVTSLGMVDFASFDVTILPPPPPEIARQPATQSVNAGTDVLIGAVVTGVGPIALQWFKDGVPLLDALSDSIAITAADAADAGTYRLEATNGGGTAVSDEITLTVFATRQPNAAEFVVDNVPNLMFPGQTSPASVTIRNMSDVSWSAAQKYAVALGGQTDQLLFPGVDRIAFADPLDVVAAGGGEFSFVTTVTAPETPGDYSIELRMIEEQVEFFPGAADTPLAVVNVTVGSSFAMDFTGTKDNRQGWLGGAVSGFGGSVDVQAAGGLCLTVAQTGDNFVAWFSPANLIPLIDGVVYRLRVEITTDQAINDAVPLFNFVYSNFQPSIGFLNYGGERWTWDSSGGANGFGRPGGLSTVNYMFAPLPMRLNQWIDNDAGSGAFDPEADPLNDISLAFRVLDLDGSSSGSPNDPLLAAQDAGTICIARITVDAIPLADLTATVTNVYNPPLDDGSNVQGEEDPAGATRRHFPQTNINRALFPTLLPDIFFNRWIVEFPPIDETSDPLGLGFLRATLGPDVVAAGPIDIDPGPGFARNPLRLYPIVWGNQEAYMIRSVIASLDANETSDPVDLIILTHETFTAELGGLDFVTTGADLNQFAPGDAGGMLRAGSPRGTPGEYVSFFHANNVTTSLIENAAQWKTQVDLFNRFDLSGGPESGQDGIAVSRLMVDRIIVP